MVGTPLNGFVDAANWACPVNTMRRRVAEFARIPIDVPTEFWRIPQHKITIGKNKRNEAAAVAGAAPRRPMVNRSLAIN
jgi:hypothetical protein